MGAEDVIKKSVLELDNFKSAFTLSALTTTALTLLISMLFGLLICYVYHKFYRGVIYSRSFSITLVGMCVLTTMVTLAISTNIVISLGMVGALSIVRYRTAVKEPLDLVYLFWAITTGITTGAKMYPLCIFSAVIMVIMLMIFTGGSKTGNVYIVVIHYSGQVSLDAIRRAMGNVSYRIKSRALRGETSEIALEAYYKNDNMAFVERLQAIEEVDDVTMIQYDGEYHA